MNKIIVLIITLVAFGYLCGQAGQFAYSLKSFDKARIETALNQAE